MAVFIDEFESGDFTAWDGTNGTPQVVSTTHHHGTYCMEFMGIESAYADLGASYNEIWTRLYVKFNSLPGSEYYGIDLMTVGAAANWNYGTTVRVQNDDTGCFFGLYSASYSFRFGVKTAITTGVWYCVELYRHAGLDNASVLYLNGSVELNDTGVDYYDADRVLVGGEAQLSTTAYIDCVIVDNSSPGCESDSDTTTTTSTTSTTTSTTSTTITSTTITSTTTITTNTDTTTTTTSTTSTTSTTISTTTTPPPCTQIQDCDDLTNLSVLNGSQATDGVDFQEGSGSWKITGDNTNWYSYSYLQLASLDWSSYDSLKFWAKYITVGGVGEEQIYIADDDGDSITWSGKYRSQLVAGSWVEVELGFSDYDSETGTFDASKCDFIQWQLRNAASERVYYFDDIRVCGAGAATTSTTSTTTTNTTTTNTTTTSTSTTSSTTTTIPPCPRAICLYFNSYTGGARDGWTKVGSTPYLQYVDYAVNYIDTNVSDDATGDFGIEDTAQVGFPSTVEVSIFCMRDTPQGYINVYVDDGGGFVNAGTITPDETWAWKALDVSSILDTFTKVNAAKVYFEFKES